VLVEARSRKGVFLKEAVRALGLSERVEVRTERFEGLRLKDEFLGQFDLLTVRAVRVGPDELEELASLLKIGGQLLLFRGEERSAPSPGQQLTFVRDLPLSTASRGVITEYSRCSTWNTD
jgi:16S rRNA G527 N7-methylase RsmG